MAAAKAIVPTSGEKRSYRNKSVALDVHFAVWDDNVELLKVLLASDLYGTSKVQCSFFTRVTLNFQRRFGNP